jgi:hypothetical protein
MSAFEFMHVAFLSWREILFGFDKGYIKWSDVADAAKTKVTEPEDTDHLVWSLAHSLSKIDGESTPYLRANLARLADLEPQADSTEMAEKWLYVLLAKIRDEPCETVNRFAKVEQLYAEFDYPHVMVPFVPYMPTLDGYDASKHSKQENMERLLANWDAYLASMRVRFAK